MLLWCVGGHNLRDLDPTWYRRHIGLVSQEPVLFARSIADNITYGKDDATMDEVRVCPGLLAPSPDLCLAFFFLCLLLPFSPRLPPLFSLLSLLPQVEEVAKQANAQEFITSFEVSPENLVLK